MEQIELGANTPATTTHDVKLDFTIAQDGTPFLESSTTYHHCSAAITSYIVGSITGMSGPLGMKGKKAKDGAFAVDMKVSVDGQQQASGAWDGLTREGSLAFEKGVLETWLRMNHDATVHAKAYGKI